MFFVPPGGVVAVFLNLFNYVIFILSVFIIIGKMSFWLLLFSGIFIYFLNS